MTSCVNFAMVSAEERQARFIAEQQKRFNELSVQQLDRVIPVGEFLLNLLEDRRKTELLMKKRQKILELEAAHTAVEGGNRKRAKAAAKAIRRADAKREVKQLIRDFHTKTKQKMIAKYRRRREKREKRASGESPPLFSYVFFKTLSYVSPCFPPFVRRYS